MSGHDNSKSMGIGWVFLFAVILIAMYVIAKPASSQVAAAPQGCAKTAEIVKLLTGEYGETAAFAGISTTGTPVLIFTNPKTGTFTITMRQPGGITCMMTGGKNWTPVDQPKEGTDL